MTKERFEQGMTLAQYIDHMSVNRERFVEALDETTLEPEDTRVLARLGAVRRVLVLTEEAAHATLQLTQAPVVLVGHSHVALALALDGNAVAGGVARGGTELELTGRRLLNPGSVGQPRDGDPRAAWLLLDLERRFAAFHRVAYPIEKTQSEMLERGLPPALAARLERGE